ncbi:zinc fingers and homeoboxes protein 2-like [Esox lucius]|uniref:Zinc fingers and homeoboxes 2a n=1 Tax=Esox lucius TaxID=8010 RepID=A0A3P9AB60_ESOLU|nr:zinc fingers and homeoboxes protein 2-like [Esox lucius]XP_010898793.2 zinc fingers and homeoboxes protein 2-like [Esox lucius]XP_010898794.2 zinc fingers and homeoboxes protein 2-like [Esox lucius]XP_010898795.2 zinc fingers and homeoboxes protein 2-like [Esox lucius]
MSSRRKSSTPCMIRVSDVMEQDISEQMDVSTDHMNRSGSSESLESQDQRLQDTRKETGSEIEAHVPAGADPVAKRRQHVGYECKYCPFFTQNLNEFKEHVDSSHPNVILNPLYLCAVCNFSTNKFDSLTDHNESQHPGETNFKFKRVKGNNQTILEQTIEGKTNSVACDTADGLGGNGFVTFPLSKPTTGKLSNRIMDNIQSLYQENNLVNQLENIIPKEQITSVNINGTMIIPDPPIIQGLSYVMPLLQRPPNFTSLPKIAVPLNSTKYNHSLDNNVTLMTSFNKFPYPTHAELSWLTAESKHTEDQIKVWFTTQRLKQGITWSPEEVEEARKKMFNGSIPPMHQTFTVLPTPVSQPAKATQPLIQSSFGQPGLVLTSIANGSSMTCAPVAVTVASYVQALKRPLMTTSFAPGLKRSMAAPAEDPKEKILMAPPPVPPKERLPMAPPPVPPEIKRSVASPIITSEIKRSSAAPLMAPQGKVPMANSLVISKNMLPVASSQVFPEMKRPIVTPQFKSYMLPPPLLPSKDKLPISHSLLAPDLKLPISPSLIVPQVRRPTIIQSVRTPLKGPCQLPCLSLDGKKSKVDTELNSGYIRERLSDDKVLTPLGEANGVPRGNAHNSILQSNNELAMKPEQQKSVPTQFPLLERMKGKTSEQLKILEENFQRNSFPTHNDIDSLVTTTQLSREEIDSWFVERRALRDNLEKALLNSIGSKRIHFDKPQQHGPANGVHKQVDHPRTSPLPIVAPNTTCSVPLDSKSLGLLKDVFAQTLWPSPEEYIQLEAQTGLARTEIVRWFKENRSALKNGTLEWMELFHKLNSGGQNGHGALLSTENTFSIIQRCQDVQAAKVEDIGRLMEQGSLSSQEIKDWFASKLRQNTSDITRIGGENGGSREGFGSWMEETRVMDARMGAQDLVLDKDRGIEDSSGRVTG